jgi:uncharacterized protein (TIGR02246 family)
MRHKNGLGTKAAVIGLVVVAIAGWAIGKPVGPGHPTASEGQDPAHEADREAIQAAARDFAEAFAKGDARAAAAHWTELGEYEDEFGVVLRGRAAIEKAFAESFQSKNRSRLEIQIESIRFPSRDCAIEDGILRETPDGAELPTSTRYRAFQVREDGKWRIAQSREWDIGQDRLEDLSWLLGAWKGNLKDQEISLSFTKDGDKPFLLGKFTRKAGGKVTASGTMRIGFNAQRGRLHSWHFDDAGGHGEASWSRDGNRWVMDAVSVLLDGTEASAINLLARTGKDEFTWRSVGRVSGGEPLSDTLPIKLSRAAERK